MSDVPRRNMVLLVDDHDLTRRALAYLLRTSGYDVRTAVSGHAAINFLSLFKPDVIVLDLTLPDLNGAEVLQWVRADPFLADTPVLIFSGDRDYLAANSAFDAEACLLKGSVSWHTLLERVDRLTKSGNAPRVFPAGWQAVGKPTKYPLPPT